MRVTASFLVLLVALASTGFGDERLERLPPNYRQWLEEEVVYIITDPEREVFLSLETREERERFIEAFWRIRDPDPATQENEFFVEHYRRIEYAKEKLSRETARPGWKTDRGRMYIILGEPRQLTRFEASGEIVQCELWMYPASPSKGIPSSFNLLFFRRRGMGEYELYNPVLHGPNALMIGYQFTAAAETGEAMRTLQRISPELARASLTLDLSEPVDYGSPRAALGTDILLARIEDSAKRSIRTDYADAYLRYRDRVTADYSFRYVSSESEFLVLHGPDSTSFVHFTIELQPENFALQVSEDGSKFYTRLDVTREVRTPEGVLVSSSEEEVYLELPESEFRKGARLPVAYQDAFPLIPGEFQVSVVLRNRAVKQFTVAEARVRIDPIRADEPALSELILGYLHEVPMVAETPGYVRAFEIENDRIYPAVRGLFPIGAKLVVLTQVHGARAGSALRFSLRDNASVLDLRGATMQPGRGAVVQEFSLVQMTGGTYELRGELLDPDGAVVAERSGPVTVSPLSTIARPGFIYRRGFPDSPGLLSLTLGEQLWSLGRFEEATAAFSRAVAAGNPELLEATWKLAAALLSARRADEALELLAPMEERFPQRFEVIGALGYAYYFKKDYGKAREFFERAALLRSPDTALLNAMGGTYQELGEIDKALDAYRRSLRLDPSQEETRARVESLEQRPLNR